MGKTYDFAGWATKANLLCSDGRVIRKDAFMECDGTKVPLVWNHSHNRPEEVLGHALLENREDGVYAYCSFNDSDSAQHAKLLVQHGDINQLSIYANKLKHQGCNVVHGIIREVSLVLAGANPGAYIESVMMHGDDTSEEGHIFTGEDFDYVAPLTLEHADKTEKSNKTEKLMEGEEKVAEETKKPEPKDEGEKTVAEVFDTFTEEQKTVVYALIGQALEDAGVNTDEEEEEVKHSKEASESDDDDEETVEDVFNTFSEKQKTVVYALIGQALEEAGVSVDDEDDVKHSDDAVEENENEDLEGGENDMKHNVFENETNNQEFLSHADMAEIMSDAKRKGSLKEAWDEYSLAHGITDIEMLFPEAQATDAVPGFIKRDDNWVNDVMGAVHHTPFSRIKSVFADITEADARAKGYIKGNLKVEEVFSLLKRVTTPTTVYKKQKLDRDDIIDITDFDVVAWLKSEMRMMLEEEIARAVLVGDGRSASSNDKINEQNIRPIWTDDDVYTVKAAINVAADASDDVKAKSFIKATIKSRKNYKGSGNPVMFMSEDMLTNCLLLEDATGRVIYDTVDKLATALRVKKIVPVPVMENLTRIVGANTHELAGIYVNMKDYNIGADKGGAVNMFDDFDIDYNQQKYLIETRCSGALTVPFSAVAIEFVSATV